MTVNMEEETRVMVGIQMDKNGRELIDWVISNVANCGDRVIAVVVSRSSDLCGTSYQSLVKQLDVFLSVYQDICALKQVVLVGRVARGTSIRKTLVKEAEKCDAAVVIVGLNKNCSLSGSASVAKYCAKKLRPSTALFAVQNGKVVYERESSRPVVKQNVDKSSDNDRRLVVYDPNPKPGWPLLKKAIRANVEPLKERNMSVVQWVMNLPDRSLSFLQSSSCDVARDLEVVLEKNLSSCKWFQSEELRASTDQFSSDKLIGKGGTSQVYKGRLSDGKDVAIKMSKLSKDIISEIDIITTLHDNRIVPLIGICVESESFFSIYEYFPRGSLEENLHGNKSKPPLSWDTRFKIAVGVAEGLNYLHNLSSRRVIHRDIKSSNILLTDDFEPLISDFGLAMWTPTDSSFETQNDVVGTFGYLAPEYFMYGKVSDKIDVYAYGVVLLELLTGRKPINDESPKNQESLVMWATRILEKEDLKQLLDSELDGNFNEDQVRRTVIAATLCIRRRARLRPQMSQIIQLLKGEHEIAVDNVCGDDQDCQDDEVYPASSVGSHLSLALLDVEDDDASTVSFEQNHLNSLDEYLKERWSRSPSFE